MKPRKEKGKPRPAAAQTRQLLGKALQDAGIIPDDSGDAGTMGYRIQPRPTGRGRGKSRKEPT